MSKKEYRLPREFGEEWVAALRSGDYNQTTGYLYDERDNGYCCLGVACRLEYPLHYLRAAREGNNNPYATQIIKEDDEYGLKMNLHKIPAELKGEVHNNELVAALVSLNDDESYTFKEIADWIEENVEFYD